MTTLINATEVNSAIAAGYVLQPNGTYAHPDHLAKVAARRAARNPSGEINGDFYLEKGDLSVLFRVNGDKVLIVRRRPGEPFGRRVTLTRALARVEYRHLLNQGYKPW